MKNVMRFQRMLTRIDQDIALLAEFTCDLVPNEDDAVELEDRFYDVMNRLHHITDQLIEQEWLNEG